jgi:hypothetical protein
LSISSRIYWPQRDQRGGADQAGAEGRQEGVIPGTFGLNLALASDLA